LRLSYARSSNTTHSSPYSNFPSNIAYRSRSNCLHSWKMFQISSTNTDVLATWDIRSGNRLLRTMERAFLPKHVRDAYNQRGSFCVCAPTVHHFHKEEVLFVWWMYSSIKQCVSFCFHTLQERVLRWLKPPMISIVLGTFADLTRGKSASSCRSLQHRTELPMLDNPANPTQTFLVRQPDWALILAGDSFC
jgi:hypothetical protein